MAHNTEVVAWERINNGQHRICVRCCGDKDTDHWHAIDVMAPDEHGVMRPVDKTKRDANIQKVHEFVAAQHAEMQSHTNDLLDHMGVAVDHKG